MRSVTSSLRGTPSLMDRGSGSTLGLDFSNGLVFANDIYRSLGVSVHPTDGMDPFIMLVSFSRHDFRL